ncbi:uncharacterized protein LOC136093761 [Hydra vulgaris]|uniref:uncharacterized protein LOC136093761 n=1 Tax=Hydra vulgaris TaxID=6087 RepID=UPI0032E9C469
MPIKATILWNYFNKVTVSGVKCRECKKCQIQIKLTDGFTSGIRYHLKTKHPTDYATMLRAQIELERQREEDIKEITEAAFELNDAYNQRSQKGLSKYVNGGTIGKYSSQSGRQLETDMVIMSYIARSSSPFTLVDEPCFKEMVEHLNPKVIVKHSSTFSRYKLPLLYESVMDTVQNLIEKEVSTCQQVAITTDGWTSRSQDPYITLTLHYINSQFELKKYVLNFDNFVGRHTGYHISKALEEMIQKYPVLDAVPKKVIVHDAAANMKHAVSIMNKTKYESLLCADHLLNTSLLHSITMKCKKSKNA